MVQKHVTGRVAWAAIACVAWLGLSAAQAQNRAPAAHKPAAKPVVAAAAPKPAMLSGPGWKVGPQPAWVIEAPPVPDSAMQRTATPATATATASSEAAPARRELLVDSQQRFDGRSRALFFRLREMATDASTLGQVSQPRIEFNPAFQTVCCTTPRCGATASGWTG